jgi:hypothetical protein
LYWIYCTVNEGRTNPSFIVTNDLTRDHKIFFLDSRSYLRWRTSQIVHFQFSNTYFNNINNSNYTSTDSNYNTSSISSNSNSSSNNNKNNTVDISSGEVFFFHPGFLLFIYLLNFYNDKYKTIYIIT